MNDDPLATYLHDHLAGASAALDLIEALRDQHAGEPLGEFAAALHSEVSADRALVESLAERVGSSSSGLKEIAAWVTEKATRLKLSRKVAGELGTFEALEGLALGILGKRALWRALAVISPLDPRLGDMDFDVLVERAEAQHAQVETRRLAVARAALQPVPA
jgi:hypothetical protein